MEARREERRKVIQYGVEIHRMDGSVGQPLQSRRDGIGSVHRRVRGGKGRGNLGTSVAKVINAC